MENDVECLDDPPSINTLPSDSDYTAVGRQTTMESVSQSTVESTTESVVESTTESTSEITSVIEEETDSVVESLVSLVTTESAESLQHSESMMEQISSSDDFKDCVESSARKRKSTRKTNPEVEPKRGEFVMCFLQFLPLGKSWGIVIIMSVVCKHLLLLSIFILQT